MLARARTPATARTPASAGTKARAGTSAIIGMPHSKEASNSENIRI